MTPPRRHVIELSDDELDVILLLSGIGLSAFDAPAGPAYALKARLEKKRRRLFTEQDIINAVKKFEKAREEP